LAALIYPNLYSLFLHVFSLLSDSLFINKWSEIICHAFHSDIICGRNLSKELFYLLIGQ